VVEIPSRKRLLIGFIEIVIAALYVLLLVIALQEFYTRVAAAQVAGVIVSGILTAFLILLYSKQTEVQRQQTQILDNQSTPQVNLRTVSPELKLQQSGDAFLRLTMELENVGTGVAANPFVSATVSSSESTSFSLDISNTTLDPASPGQTDSLSHREEKQKFYADFDFYAKHTDEPDPLSIPADVVFPLYADEVDGQIILSFDLKYRDAATAGLETREEHEMSRLLVRCSPSETSLIEAIDKQTP